MKKPAEAGLGGKGRYEKPGAAPVEFLPDVKQLLVWLLAYQASRRR